MANLRFTPLQSQQGAIWSDPLSTASILWLRGRNQVDKHALALQNTLKAQGIGLKIADVFDVTSSQIAGADLILLDAFECLDGTIDTVLTRIRIECRVPLVILTTGYSTDQLVAALTAGADEIWTVRIPAEVLIARCKAILRRSALPST